MNADENGNGPKSRRKAGRIKVILRRAVDDARQMTHPGPFRIDESPDIVMVSEDAMLGIAPAGREPMAARGLDADSKHLLKVVAAVATAIWRARAKLENQAGVELPSEFRHLPRHVQAAWDALASGGIEIQDLTGQRYVPGMAVNPITFQPMEGVGTEVIHETIKPSVFYKDILIQRADVIVARPIDERDDPRPADLPGSGEATDSGAAEPADRDTGAPAAAAGQQAHPTE